MEKILHKLKNLQYWFVAKFCKHSYDIIHRTGYRKGQYNPVISWRGNHDHTFDGLKTHAVRVKTENGEFSCFKIKNPEHTNCRCTLIREIKPLKAGK